MPNGCDYCSVGEPIPHCKQTQTRVFFWSCGVSITMIFLLFLWWLIPADNFLSMSSTDMHLQQKSLSSAELLSSPRVFIDGSNMYNPTGGPEALIQLSLAFFSFLPHQTQILPYKDIAVHWNILDSVKYLMGDKTHHFTEFIHPRFQSEYPQSARIPIAHARDMVAGDILILPEIWPCPENLVADGISVHIWVLGASEHMLSKLSKSNCSILSHNYWLSHNLGVNIPSTSVLRPYVASSVLPKTQTTLAMKRDLILIDNDSPLDVVDSIFHFCEDFGCTAVVVKDFTQPQLLLLYEKAKIVIDWCMRGNERMPIEAVLHGALLITSDCECAQDQRDFPIPQQNIVPHIAAYRPFLETTMHRLLTKYSEGSEGYEHMREMYGRSVSAMSLVEETRNWYYDTRADFIV
jgi:hypothetical protein